MVANGNGGRKASYDGRGTERKTSGDENALTGTQRRLCADGGTTPESWRPTDAEEPPTYGSVKSMDGQQWVQAVYSGFTTRDDLSTAMDVAPSTVSRNLGDMAEDPSAPIVKTREGKQVAFRYDAEAAQGGDGDQGGQQGGGDGSTGGTGGDRGSAGAFPKAPGEYPGSMPDYRHQVDTDEAVPQDVPEYYPSGTEMDDLRMYAHQIRTADPVDPADPSVGDFAGKEPLAVQMVGPTGAGKTHAPKKLAEEEGARYYEVTMKDSVDPSDMEGYPNVLDDLTTWVDGPIVEPLLASREGFTVLVLDEVNRAPPSVRSVFMSVLDKRAALGLPARGGETVHACKENLLVVTTRNPSDSADYDTYDMDRAQASRLGRYNEVDYLGANHPDREAELVAEREGVDQGWARNLVDAANDVREAADAASQGGAGGGLGDAGNGNGPEPEDIISRGVPTRNLLMMARDARMAADSGHPSPSSYAVDGYLNNDYDGEALDLVRTMFRASPATTCWTTTRQGSARWTCGSATRRPTPPRTAATSR